MPFPPIPKIPDFRKLKPRFGDLLRDHRTLQGLSIEDLAAEAEIAPAALSEIEAGTRPSPPKKVVKALADALDLTGEDKSDFFDVAELSSLAMNGLFGPGGMFAPAAPEKQAS